MVKVKNSLVIAYQFYIRVNPGFRVGGLGMHVKMGGKREVVHLQGYEGDGKVSGCVG